MALTDPRKSQKRDFPESSQIQLKISRRENLAIARLILHLATQPSLAQPWHSPSLRLDHSKMHCSWRSRLHQLIEILRHQSKSPLSTLSKGRNFKYGRQVSRRQY